MSDTLGGASDDPAAAVPPANRAVFETEGVPPTVLYTPQEADQRPWDSLGPPSDPLTFDRPRFDRGRRDQVLCYIPSTQSYERLDRVLFRDEAMSGVRRVGGRRIESAYYPVPYKKAVNTIMGHVEFCFVLQRSRLGGDDDDDDSRGSEEDFGEEDDDDEVCFELTDRLVAVKVNFDSKMRELRNRHAEDPLKEIAAMQLIGDSNPHVLGCSEVLYDPGNQTLNIVMRFCQSGDLFQRLQESQASADDGPPGLPEGQARYWFRQIMRGVKALHEQGICHRDLSPENIMLDEDESIIIDLGMCLRVPYDEKEQQRRCLIKPQGACGKLPYMSPEIYRNRSPFDGAAADVWTTGTILFCMVTGNRSYQRAHASDPQFYWMTRDLNQLLTDWGIQLSPEGFHLLQNILQVNPRLRLTIDEVLDHPWFRFPDERPLAPMEF
jgi:serine/threonine protein kinase